MASLKILDGPDVEILDSVTFEGNTILATSGGAYVLSGPYLSKIEPAPVDIHDVVALPNGRFGFPRNSAGEGA